MALVDVGTHERVFMFYASGVLSTGLKCHLRIPVKTREVEVRVYRHRKTGELISACDEETLVLPKGIWGEVGRSTLIVEAGYV